MTAGGSAVPAGYRQVKGVISPCRFSSTIRRIYNDLPMIFGFQATVITATAKT
jgi:hypothetical protein